VLVNNAGITTHRSILDTSLNDYREILESNQAAALECAQYGIRVNSIHPGVIATPMIMQGDTKDAVEAFAKSLPMKRVAQPEEVSGMVLFLASDDSSYSTGSEFSVDGGLTAQ
jgi:3alpha(or 20beta)-hydroxysteroid dehydrogenase